MAHLSGQILNLGLSKNIWTEVDGDFKYRNFYHNIVEFIEDLPDDDREQLFKDWNMKLFKNEDGREVGKHDVDDSVPSSARDGGSDLACLHVQMAAHNAAVKTRTATDSEHPTAPATAHPPPAQENIPRTPPASFSPARNILTPCPVPRPRPIPQPAKTPTHPVGAREDSPVPERAPLLSSPTCNIPVPSEPGSPSPEPAPSKPVLQAHSDASGSELTESDEEEQHQAKQKAPAKRKRKSKAAAPVRKPAARSTKKQKK
ncbi:uncharacterized protein HD556DRAFT_1445425 [Suillus plorans]|uniref:Uncharacterized protein n=1 Tax=Suillus plorans TaxID=116603 RepID=A0A9P7DFW7_9AGAM|nr:uncharacterized protein HD556DRAFT_1445425 [Suillus plorans]KAG1791169.1 hypothetical protein HD556DRAFT_1445425 [Suillus plorans]